MFQRFQAHFSAQALTRNYETIRSLVPGQAILPMIKANAYGHGAAWAARLLATEPGLYGFGVATLEEGAEIRKALAGTRGKNTRIVVVSGTALWTEEKGQYCERYGLTAVISSEEDWVNFLRGGWNERIAYELKFNTGMNRLGIPPGYARVLARKFKEMPSIAHPSGIMSHLAASENSEEKLSQSQRELFKSIRAELSEAVPSTHFHLGNSGAVWNAKSWGLDELTDVVRPGIALYGIPPWAGAPQKGLIPVMSLWAKVIATHILKPGDRVGYGGIFRAQEKMTIATLSVGYGDGWKRSLSGSSSGDGGGYVYFGPARYPILGIVSMDLCSVQCPPSTKPGDWALLLGPGIDPWEQAKAARTIPYELFTSVAHRVERIYE